MLPIKTILAATDFSPMSDYALHFAGALARDYGARLIVVHVVPPPAVAYGEMTVFVEESDRDAARAALEKVSLPGVAVEHRLLEGDPSDGIVATARATTCDLIVLGTHGRTGLLRVILGSIAEDVLRHAPCPVLTVRGPVAAVESAETPAAEAAHV